MGAIACGFGVIVSVVLPGRAGSNELMCWPFKSGTSEATATKTVDAQRLGLLNIMLARRPTAHALATRARRALSRRVR
jgi:hypothetical protein